ncbi:MAG: hypothetical protein NTX52_07760 [Planctomycetota bacterium]|nr:hypothetical protein [Planctomycetota bacterium]
MKKERLIRPVRGIALCLFGILLLSGEIYANQVSPSTKNNPAGRDKEGLKQSQTAKNIPAGRVRPGKQLERTIDLSALQSDTPFSKAIEVFRNSTKPPLNIVVLWRDIEENSDVTRDTPIGMEAISGISLGKNLEFLLMSVSSDPKKLGYVVENGVVLIGTKDSLPNKREARVYDVTDLVSAPANYFPAYRLGGPQLYGGGYGMPYGGYGGYGGTYGGGYGMPYGGYGEPLVMSGYRTNAGRIRTGRSIGVSPYVMGGYGYNRGQDIASLIQTHTFERSRPPRNNSRR